MMTTSAQTGVFIARQPILGRHKELVGYELLARRGTRNAYTHEDGDVATSQTVDVTLNLMGMETLVGEHKAYINFTRTLLVGDIPRLLPRERTVVELLEGIDPDQEVVAACKRLKSAGFTLALDDFMDRPGYDRLIALADIIKVDFMLTPAPARTKLVERYAGQGKRMLAEKVETHAEYREALDAGYSYFQGYFFSKPEMMQGRRIPSFKSNYLRFLQEVNRPDADFNALEEAICRDLSLSMRLLKYLNSAAMGVREEITSVKHALTLLGERPLRRWASLVALLVLGGDKPPELLKTSLVRARFCELLAPMLRMEDRTLDLFMLGLLSLVDAMMDRTMAEVVGDLPLPTDMRLGLLNGRLRLGQVNQLVISYERGIWPLVDSTCQRLQISAQRLPGLYEQAVEWAEQVAAI